MDIPDESSILMKQEPVSTIQVSSGRLESTRALKDMKRGIEPMVSDLPGWRANHYTTGARYFSCADPSICIDYCDQSSFDKSDRWHLGPEERSTHEGRHINETRTCFDHLGLIRKARKHESAQGYERSG